MPLIGCNIYYKMRRILDFEFHKTPWELPKMVSFLKKAPPKNCLQEQL